VGRDAVLIAVGRRGRRAATEAKIGVPRIANRPAASSWDERDNRQGCLCLCLCLCLCRCRLDGVGSEWLRFGTAIRPGGGGGDGGGGGGLFDLGDRNRPSGQEAGQNGDAVRQVAIAVLPMTYGPRADAEELREAALRDVERAEFGRSRRWGHIAADDAINRYLHEGKLLRPLFR